MLPTPLRSEADLRRSTKNMNRSFAEIFPELERDGALRDFYIPDTDIGDWNKLLEWVAPLLESDCFYVDSKVSEFPKSFTEIEKIRESASPLLSIPVADSYLNCHFFHFSEIELDFWPQDYQSEYGWTRLCGFLQDLVDLIGKRGIVAHENSQDEVIEEFKPNDSNK
jgi:hypothetical protein